MKSFNKSQFPSSKQYDEDLSEIVNQYQEFLELARDVIFTLSPDGLVITLNNTFQSITGWLVQEWIGKPFTDLLHPDDIPLVMNRLSNMLNRKTSQSIEVRIQKKSGDYVFCEVLATPKVKNGKIIKILGIGRDISRRKRGQQELLHHKEHLELIVAERTAMNQQLVQEIADRKQAEEAIKTSRDFLDKIINTVDSPLFVKNAKHEFYLVNDTLCSLLKLSVYDLIGKTGLEHFDKEQFDIFVARDQEVLDTGKENINEEDFTDGQGSVRRLITRKTLYTDPAGNKFIVGTTNDITEGKHAEIKIKNQLEELQRWHEVTLDREDRILELKQQVNELLKNAGKPPRYEYT